MAELYAIVNLRSQSIQGRYVDGENLQFQLRAGRFAVAGA